MLGWSFFCHVHVHTYPHTEPYQKYCNRHVSKQLYSLKPFRLNNNLQGSVCCFVNIWLFIGTDWELAVPAFIFPLQGTAWVLRRECSHLPECAHYTTLHYEYSYNLNPAEFYPGDWIRLMYSINWKAISYLSTFRDFWNFCVSNFLKSSGMFKSFKDSYVQDFFWNFYVFLCTSHGSVRPSLMKTCVRLKANLFFFLNSPVKISFTIAFELPLNCRWGCFQTCSEIKVM